MAIKDPFALMIQGAQSLIESKTNKLSDDPVSYQKDGESGDKLDILALDLSDGELIMLSRKWSEAYAPMEAGVKKRQNKNKEFYLGNESGVKATIEEDKIVGNLLFESAETFLAAAVAEQPDPVVYSDGEQDDPMIDQVKTMLQYHTIHLGMRQKLKLMTRKWLLDFLAVGKFGFDSKNQDISFEVRDVKNFIFDPNGYVDVFGHFNGYLGERITVNAQRLSTMFPKHKSFIEEVVQGKMGTAATYTEWWTDAYTFTTFKERVLDKSKNPHFNYKHTDKDEDGEEREFESSNHFVRPLKPYVFLSVFNIGDRPHDVTGLIEQTIPNQKLISKRTKQIDFNLSRSNNSVAFSANNFTQETAKQASQGWAKGHPILVPSGAPIKDAIVDFGAPGYPQQAFEELQDNKSTLRAIFGVSGITAKKQTEDTTVRGMILNQQYDNSRIGGGIGDAVEQVAQTIFNWFTQLYYVYYDDEHWAAVMGTMKGVDKAQFSSAQLGQQKLIITVSPNSMRPRDELSEYNQALAMMEAGLLDPLTFYKRIDFPNPKETAGLFLLYKLDPQAYFEINFPEEAQLLAQSQMQRPGAQPQPTPTPQTPPLQEPTAGVNAPPENSAIEQVNMPPIPQQ